MTTRFRKRTLLTVSVLAMGLLGGCLMEEETAEDTAETSGGTANAAPSISGNPPTAVKMGDNYSFTPSASDPDGDALTFSVQNRPNWASFDSSSGVLSGTPSLANVGVFENIRISVSDGATSIYIPAFSVTVSQVALGSVTLSWTPPTQNMDGSTLTDLAGYRIYYGTEEGNYPNRVEIETPGIATYVVENLIPQTYYFVTTSVNRDGIESPYSNFAVKSVDAT